MTFHKYPKIFTVGHEDINELLSNPEDDIFIEEKIDGGNFRFMVKDGKIIFGSRTQSIGDDQKEIGGNWKRCVEFIRNALKGKYFTDMGHLIFYGECCVLHTIHYDFDKIPPYLGFDIYNIDKEVFINWNIAKEIFGALGLPVVPLINTCKAKDITILTDADIPKSFYYSGQSEGIVLKNYNKQIFGKYVTNKFKEVNKEVFGSPKKWAKNDSERIVAVYCTNSRIDKLIFTLIDEGYKLELSMMKYLPKRVIEDIYLENWRDICFSNWSVNFKDVRKKTTNRCLHVLQQVIVNNFLNKIVVLK